MNIIVHRYNSICEPDYIRAFQKIGLTVIEDQAEMTRKKIPGDERVRTIATMILEHRPLFVFTINFFPYISDVCEKLRVLYVSVSVDCPVAEIYDRAIRNSSNRVFLFDREQYLSVCEENPSCIFHIPLGADVERIEEEIGDFAAFRGRERYDYDISFVGSLYNEANRKPEDRATHHDRVNLLNALAENLPDSGVHLFTHSSTDELRKVVCHGGVQSHGEMPAVFRKSKVNLNTTMRGIRTGLPQRIWDVLGSGGFLLTNAQAELPVWLTIGKQLDIYETTEEAAERVKWWLAHEEERQMVAEAGYKEVKARHKVLDRVVAIMKIVLRDIGQDFEEVSDGS